MTLSDLLYPYLFPLPLSLENIINIFYNRIHFEEE